MKNKYFLKSCPILLEQAQKVFSKEMVDSAYFCEILDIDAEDGLEKIQYMEEKIIDLLHATQLHEVQPNHITLDATSSPSIVVHFTQGRHVFFSTTQWGHITCIDEAEKHYV